jgi:hypothetical protein
MSRGLALAVSFTVLANGCTTLPANHPVTIVVAGEEIETKVDSEVAAYLANGYLAGERHQAEWDRRIDALYREHDGDSLPDRGQLKGIADAFSVDFAAIYFADLINRRPANGLLRKTYDRHLQTAKAAHAQGETPPLMPGAGGYDVVFAPGYHYRKYPETGADLAAPRRALSDAGLATDWIETGESSSIEANSELIAEYLRSRAPVGRKIIMISASKSGPEVALALSQLSREDAQPIKAWINIVGTLQGTPLADEVFGDGVLSGYRAEVEDAGLRSMTTSLGRARYRRFKTPDDLLIINYIGIPVTGTVSDLAQDFYMILRPYGPNDGLNLMTDVIAPKSLTLAEFGRDHYLHGKTIRPRTLALVYTTIQWLESCRKGVGMPWFSTKDTAHCGIM